MDTTENRETATHGQDAHATTDNFAAAIPEPYQILGLRLLPLSLGRYRLLRRFGVAFVSEEETTADISDLILGVLICSMRCEEWLSFYESESFESEIRRWAKRIGAYPPWYLRNHPIISASFIGKRWRRRRSFNFIEKIQLFKNYIAEAQRVPEYAPVEQQQQNSSAHWSEIVEISLRSELNWTTADVDEAPLSKALSDHFKHLENQGLVKIFTEEDLEAGRANAAALELFEKMLGGARGT